MRNRLLALAIIGIMLIFMAWLASNPSSRPRLAPTNGPLVLIVTGQIRSTNDLTVIHREGLTRRFALTSSALSPELTNALMIQITNPGKRTFEIWGYNSGSPIYSTYVDGTNGLKQLEAATPERVPALVYLGPTQSLSFPVIPPVTDRPWHVCISYRDFLVTAPLPFVAKSPTPFENLISRTRALIPFLRKPEPGFYFTMSESIVSPGRQGQTMQRTKAGHSLAETNRAPSEPGSRR